jgi:hypothetical protein
MRRRCCDEGQFSPVRYFALFVTDLTVLPFRRGLLLPPGVWWGPIVDSVELPLAAIRAGDFARVPRNIGTARDEGTLHTLA